MNKTLFTLLLGAGVGFAVSKLLESEKGQEWREKIADLLTEVSEELKTTIMAEIDKFETLKTEI